MKLSNLFPPVKTENKAGAPTSKKAVGKSSTTTTQAVATDQVKLSASSLDVQKMKNILQETPAVRMEKVQALKEQIERGEYQVEPYRVADKMLMDLLSDNISSD